MSRTKELAKSSVSILLSQGCTVVISIIFVAYFARVFELKEMALFAFVAMLAGWAQLLGSCGFGTLAVRDVAQLWASKEYDAARRLISSVIVYRSFGVLFISILFFVASPLITTVSFGDRQYLGMIRFLIITSYIMSFRAVLAEIQTATQRFHTRSIIGVTTVLAQRIFCVIGYFAFGVNGFFVGFTLATIGGVVFTFFDIRRYLTIKLLSVNELFRKSKGYMVLDIMRGALTQVDRPVIIFLLGAEALAVYYLAKKLYDLSERSMRAIIDPIGVKFGEVKAEGKTVLKSYFQRCLTMTLSFFVPLGFFVIAVSESALLLYGGEKYIPAIPVSMWFGFTLMAASLWRYWRVAGLRLLPARHLLYQYLASSVTTLLLYFLLLPLLGEVGVPIAIGAGLSVGIIPTWYQLKKRYHLNMPRKEFLSVFCLGLSFLVFMLPMRSISNMLLRFIAIHLSSALLYLIWVRFWGPDTVKDLLKRVYMKLPMTRILN